MIIENKEMGIRFEVDNQQNFDKWYAIRKEEIRADAIDEHFRKIMSFINTNNRGSCDYFIVDQIENYIAEQLKEQKNENI